MAAHGKLDGSRHFSLKYAGITLGILAIAAALCFFLRNFDSSDTHIPLIFVLAVLFVSRMTEGYRYGIAASVIAVFGVNYVFTYPYFAFNFSLAGYPLTFMAMLAVAVSVSTLTTRIKQQEQIRVEVEKEKMRSNLLRAVSHDIRTPLTSIAGSAAFITDNAQSLSEDKKLDLVRDMKEEAEWLIRIVENLLSITRMTGENPRIDLQEELVEEVVESAAAKFKKRFKNIPVHVKVPSEVLLIPMDGILIEQVIVNLMENSVLHGKYTSQIQITLTPEVNRIQISVEDDGAGIDASILPFMFDGTLHDSEGVKSDGKRNMGIGLSVCMSIIKAHGGNMSAVNLPSGGARVAFWLPVTREESHENER